MKAQTIGQLRASGYEVPTIRQELRKNLIDRIRRNEALFPGIIGYEESVIPAMENAILSGHDIIMLGERGQGKPASFAFINLLDDRSRSSLDVRSTIILTHLPVLSRPCHGVRRLG
jgi:magnesium chelatase subunit I